MESVKLIQFERRSANYKPSIWKNEFLQSVSSKYDGEECVNLNYEKLKMEVKLMFNAADELAKLELINNITKLGLARLFQTEIMEALETLASTQNPNSVFNDIYSTALRFRLLRQHGFHVKQDMFDQFIHMEGIGADVKGMLEVYEASHLALEGEDILVKAKDFSTENLKHFNYCFDLKLVEQVNRSLQLPIDWRVQWFDVRWNINMFAKNKNSNSNLLELAKLHFNMVQAILQNDLRDMSRWWSNLGLIENLEFARDRLVESFLCSVGLAFEPQFKSFRKWLTKVINMVPIIDDVYDIYGSLDELELFTDAIDRWDGSKSQHLPKTMKICYDTLYNISVEIASEMEMEKGLNQQIVLPHLFKVWTDFCKALLVEAKWYNKGYTPSLHEYLSNAWISSSGSVLLLHAYFATTREVTEENIINFLDKNQEIVYNSSIIIRLCNDLATSKAEVERGDAPSSIICYMRQVNVSEEKAREHIKEIIVKAWMKLNTQRIDEPFANIAANAAHVAHYLYQNGDGFGVQDREIRNDIMSLFIKPLC